MAVPLPPTDNLYKFMAISGVIILISTQLLYWWAENESWVRLLELEANAAALDVERNMLARELKELSDEVDRLKKSPSRARLEQAGAEVKRQHELEDRHSVNIAQTKAKLDHVKKLERDSRLVGWLSILGAGIGIGLAAVGFYLWYVRVQVYLDRALRAARAGSRGDETADGPTR